MSRSKCVAHVWGFFRCRLRTMSRRGIVACMVCLMMASIGLAQEKDEKAGEDKADDQTQVDNDQVADYGLAKTVVRQLESKVIPAWRSGDKVAFVEAVKKIILRADTEQFEAIDRFGIDNGVPSINREFGRLVVEAVEQGNSPNFSKMPLTALAYINKYIVDRIDRDLAELRTHDVMQDSLKLRESWRENEQLFWDVHVYENVLINLRSLSDFAISINRKHYLKGTKKNDQAILDLLKPVSDLPQKIADHYNEMNENESVLRIMELELAEKALREEEDFEQRLLAAFAFELDTGHLREFFKDFDPALSSNEKLTDPELGDRISALVKSGREHGKDVITKAIHLRTGAHWWLRGRYGSGTMARGLLKSPDATRNEETMFGLYMPKARPQPISSVSYEGDIAPGYERRHFYTWAVEYRELVTNASSRSKSKDTSEKGDSKVTGTFW